ncbi:uncharacterized protein TA05305 [Theileria annulata]|uniref:thiol oxidase n=1 Tax=Theileria annulata TaxID=5874 RepID=Q4UCU3_THEAN|nr:uncharacterized protein TA05305 [Theileria annulata]CAI75358.1 hypothetical protein, conserved [Theileria annulata]|eukprot:XP_954834.1 hypothetical protein, conserved [Theileria annulata]
MAKKYNFEECLEAVDNNKAVDPCSSQWILLWMFGAYIDETPTEQQKKSLEVFYKSIPDLCTNKCYTQFLSNFPPKVDNRRMLMGWLQMAENSCRVQNGLKPKPFKFINRIINSYYK